MDEEEGVEEEGMARSETSSFVSSLHTSTVILELMQSASLVGGAVTETGFNSRLISIVNFFFTSIPLGSGSTNVSQFHSQPSEFCNGYKTEMHTIKYKLQKSIQAAIMS